MDDFKAILGSCDFFKFVLFKTVLDLLCYVLVNLNYFGDSVFVGLGFLPLGALIG
jgi:hypothetical protein